MYYFGVFRLDPAEHRLWCENELVSLTPKQFDLLYFLVRNAGRVAKKDELLETVWSEVYVEETTLTRNISWLRKRLAEYADGEQFIETVSKVGYRFTAKVMCSNTDADTIFVEEQIIQNVFDVEAVKFNDESTELDFNKEFEQKNVTIPQVNSKFRQLLISPSIVVMALTFVIIVGVSFVTFNKRLKSDLSTENLNENINLTKSISQDSKTAIKIGSIIHLKNQSSEDAGYLDAWGEIKNIPEFSIVQTELMFVSTHPSPNRDNGSGSWKIVSADGKKAGETLVYGDRIHLQNMYPDAGFLDNCGWVKDMRVLKDVAKDQKFAVFTAWSQDRDNGTGTWIIGSNTEFDKSSVLEGASISLENGFSGGGYLNVQGHINDISAFINKYDGSQLVFIHPSTSNRLPKSGKWTITTSKAVLEK